MNNKDYDIGIDFYEKNDYINAYKHLTIAADENDIAACIQLAEMYFCQYGQKDVDFCSKMNDYYIDKAISLGSIEANYLKASFISEGAETQEDYDSMYHYYKVAADQGHSDSQFMLSTWGYDKRSDLDDEKREAYFVKSLATNCESAIDHLAEMLNWWMDHEFSEPIMYECIRIAWQGDQDLYNVIKYAFASDLQRRPSKESCLAAKKALERLIKNKIVSLDDKRSPDYLTLFFIDEIIDREHTVTSGSILKSDALIEIAHYYRLGEIVPQNPDKAFLYLLKAVKKIELEDKANDYCSNLLGDFFDNLNDIWLDYIKKAIDSGSKNALKFLNLAFSHNMAIEKILNLCIEVAEKGNSVTEYLLGNYYLQTAYDYLKSAADKGNKEAQKELSKLIKMYS